jgi:hypothetical protein
MLFGSFHEGNQTRFAVNGRCFEVHNVQVGLY